VPEIRVARVHPDTTVDVGPIDRDDLTAFQSFVGGYVEAYPVSWSDAGEPTAYLWCNEDGQRLDLPPNPVATILWWTLRPEMKSRDRLLGPVLFTGGADDEGNTLPVSDDIVTLAQKAREMVRNGI